MKVGEANKSKYLTSSHRRLPSVINFVKESMSRDAAVTCEGKHHP